MSDRGGWFAVSRDGWLWDLTPEQFRVALQLLREANWKDTKVVIDGTITVIPRGSCLISRRGLAARSKVTEKRARTTIRILEEEGFLTQKRAHDGARAPSVFSIVNFNAWQPLLDGAGPPAGQHRAHTGPTEGPPQGPIRTSNKGTREQERVRGVAGATDHQPLRLLPDEPPKPRWDIERLYKLYPRKRARKNGLAAGRKAISSEADYAAALKAIEVLGKAWAAVPAGDAKRQELTFVPHFATYVNGRQWEDEEQPLPVERPTLGRAAAAERPTTPRMNDWGRTGRTESGS